ncbi:DNA internalization-related competence protein ComEC/Rec2, partial [Fructobacillus ficulneus]|uniref:DNA internalization-related competence protein ComEC/Rec2 n=1 Tax=Fructobacillus ficulneus TaxID=157463 RepID=UPI0007823412
FWQAWTFRWRSWHWALADRAHHLPQPLANYALALLLGAKDQTLYADNPKIQELGLIHLFSLSGFHVAFLLALVRWLGRRLGLYREITLAIMAVVLPSFYWLTACPPILVRAVVAGEGRILRQAGGWRVDPVTIWSWSLLVALAVHPQILLTVGGQLSFALTLALTLMPATWPSWQKGVFLSVLTFPIIVAQQYVWNCWQTVANLLAVPIFSTVILPTVLVAFLLVPVPGLAPTCNWIVASFDQTIAWVGSWPGQVVVGALAWPVLLTLFCLPWFAIGANHRCRRWLVSTWIVVLLFGWTTVRWRSTGEYTTFDIGQGDAAVLREPWNRSVTLIDTGGKVSFQRPEFGQNSGNQSPASQAKSQEGLARSVIVPYLHALGIGRINTLSLSHQDQDHLGDARVILTTFRVDQVLVPAGLPNQPAFQRKVKPYLNGAKVVEGTDQVQVSHLPLKILHPFQPGIGENEDSLALAGRLGPLTLFTAGDLDQMGEAAIQAKYSNFRPDIVKFGHHGSKTATNPTVMATWRPKYGLISAGRDNRYGHPNQETLETARANQMIVYDTRRQGMLRYVYDLNRKGYFEVTSSHDLTDPKKSN